MQAEVLFMFLPLNIASLLYIRANTRLFFLHWQEHNLDAWIQCL